MLNLRKSRPHPVALILLYHRVTTLSSDPWQLCVSPHNFREQMQWVRDNCCTVSLAEMPRVLRRPPAARPVVAMTFDDGYDDNFREALPLLEQLAIPATFFITTPWLVSPGEFWWDELDRILLQLGVLPAVLRLASDLEAPTWQLADAAQFTAQQADSTRHWRAWETPPTPRHAIYAEFWKRLYAMTPQRRSPPNSRVYAASPISNTRP